MVALVLLILLAGAALAASQLGLFDYLEGSYNMSMPADAKEAIGQNPLTQTYDLGEVTIAFHEVIADGRWFYFTALVTPPKTRRRHGSSRNTAGRMNLPMGTMPTGIEKTCATIWSLQKRKAGSLCTLGSGWSLTVG